MNLLNYTPPEKRPNLLGEAFAKQAAKRSKPRTYLICYEIGGTYGHEGIMGHCYVPLEKLTRSSLEKAQSDIHKIVTKGKPKRNFQKLIFRSVTPLEDEE